MTNSSVRIFSISALAFALCACSSPDQEKSSPSSPPITTVAESPSVAHFETELEKAIAEDNTDLAAYFAEYVLSADELTDFVEKRYPKKSLSGGAPDAIGTRSECAAELRYTLARRLLREGQWARAKKYFPEDLIPVFDAYVAAIQRGYKSELSDEERARGFWDAALIVRNYGDSLFLASAGPIYISGGIWEDHPIFKQRLSENIAGSEERSRAESRDISRFVNDRRFRAAMLVQNAASLLPNNDERTARLLCTAGVWLRYRDPKTADSFYKSIVVRCPKTSIGKHCAELRWFPQTLTWTDDQAWDGSSAPQAEDLPGDYDTAH